MLIDYYVGLRGIAVGDIGVTPLVVVSWIGTIVRSFVEATAAQRPEHWLYGDRNPLYLGSVGEQPVAIAQLPVGAPGTVMIMEEMIACGARAFIGVGFAGSLQPESPIGSFVIPTSCVRDEGTSGHYVTDDAALTASPTLQAVLLEACREEGAPVRAGPQWTTDAPYRELVSQIEGHRQQGILGVDMETSAMYALGLCRGVDVCNLLVVSDELWHDWRPAFGTPALQAAAQRAVRIVLQAVRRKLDPGGPNPSRAARR
jgi:uridine phosphorylase